MVFFIEGEFEGVRYVGTILKLRPQWKILLECLPLAGRDVPVTERRMEGSS